jgi:hypothetical protein
LLFALSFAPFAFSRVTVGFDDTVSIGFSQVDTVELSTRSLLFLTDRQKAKTDLYAELQNPAELSKLSSSQLLKKHLFLDVMSKDVSPRATVIFAAMVGVAYFAVCIIFLIVSFIDLVDIPLCLLFTTGQNMLALILFTVSLTRKPLMVISVRRF